VAVKIKLKRMGKIREPHYRIVVADARTKRDGRAIEEIGKYYPKADPSFIEVDSDRAQHWLSVGALPTDPVRKLLEVTGDWQRFKGLPGAEGTLKEQPPRTDKKQIFAAALAETLAESAAAPKGRGRAGGRAADAKAGEAKAGEAKAGEAKAGEAKAGQAKAGEAKGRDAKAGDGKAGEAKGRDAKAGDGKAKGEKADKPSKAAKSDGAKSRAKAGGGDAESAETAGSAPAEPAPETDAAAADSGSGD
jgi:small subunit ribosomal protein S16